MIAWFTALPMGRRIAFGLGAVVALIGAVAALVLAANAHDRAVRQSGRDEVQAQWNAARAERGQVLTQLQTDLIGALQPRFDHLADEVSGINATGSKISLTLPSQIAAAPRYADPNCDLTPEVREQLNSARARSSTELKP